MGPTIVKRQSGTRIGAIAVLGGFILMLASGREAAAACQNGSSAQTLTPQSNPTLYSVMRSSTAPCTLSVGPGTYTTPASGVEFAIADGITVRSTGGPAATVLQVSGGPFTSMAIWPINGSCPSGATLEGFTINGGSTGVFVGAFAAAGHGGCQVAGVTLRSLVVNTNLTPGHGIDFSSVQNSVIDSCTVNSSGGNAILLYSGANNNIVMNNTITGSVAQMSIALQSSDDNVIVGNTSVAGSFDGIMLNSSVGLSGPGSSRNRIERNTISGHRVDGIVVNDSSHSNYVGLNVTVSSSYVPGSPVAPSGGGTGIWVNNASNANYLFGNDLSGSPENGIDVLAAKSTLLVGNSVHGNYQGGIWVANVQYAAAATAPPPQDTVLHGNRSFFNTYNAMIFLQGARNSEAAYNYLSGAQGAVLASTTTTALYLSDSTTARVFENTVSEVGARAIADGTTSDARFFRNRFLRGTNVPNPPQTDGRNGVTYSLPPAFVAWDAGDFLGGNHWSEFGSAAANPDPNHPYSGFIGSNVDRYPFQSESLVLTAVPNSLSVVEPIAGSVLAAGTRKTVRWVGRGCALVDIYYGSGAAAPTLIASAYPNTGYFFWSVPSLPFRSDYFIQILCANSNDGWLGVVANSPPFTIAASDLVLLNPGRGSRAVNDGTLRVAWKASAAVTAVNIFVSTAGGGETQVAANVTASTAEIVLPAWVANSGAVRVRIQDAGADSRQDSVDGTFMVRGASPSFNTSLAGRSLQIGSVQVLEWTGLSSSYTVDLDLIGATSTAVARNLPDFGTYTWFVPDIPAATARIRVTFKDANGNPVAATESRTFRVARNASAAPIGPPTAAARHDFDGDGKTEIAVFRPSDGTWYVNYSSSGYNPSLAQAFEWGAANDIAVSGDFDGDGKIELTVFRPSNGTWYIEYSSNGYSTAGASAYQWGLPGDVPIAGDFDNDGLTDLTVYRPSTGRWYVRFSSLGYSTVGTSEVQWGGAGDLPVTADFDGDGATELTVFRPATGTWYIRYSSLGYSAVNYGQFQWGASGDLPVVGDFDLDGKTDLTIYRPSVGGWFTSYSSQGYSPVYYSYIQWGQDGDVPVSADLDGDARTDITVYRPSTGEWFALYSSRGYSTSQYSVFNWGGAGDTLVK